ncbi:LamG-like jellyroll fold domain-containing protein [Flindersiella endophytica]
MSRWTRWRRPAVALAAGAAIAGALVSPPGAIAEPPPVDAVSKLDSAVRLAAGLIDESPKSKARAVPLAKDGTGRVVVYVEGDDSRALTKAVVAAGGEVSDADSHRVRAAVPPKALVKVAGSAAVREVRRPEQPVPLEVISEGVQPSNALAWHGAGSEGAGAKVGIIDVGFGALESTKQNGDLPDNTPIFAGQCDNAGGSTHGTAVAEVVHDMAPAAQLYFACVEDSMGFDDAARWLVDQGVDVVNVSLAFPGTGRGDGIPFPSDADWTPATVVAWLRGEGVTVIAAAGNEANKHMSGVTADNDGNTWMEIAGSTENLGFSVGGGRSVTVELKWDAWPRTTQDLDLYIMDEARKPVDLNDPQLGGRYSIRSQKTTDGGLTPVETYTFTSASANDYFIYVKNNGATAGQRYDLTVYGDVSGLSDVNSAMSIAEPASSPWALAVGAITPASAASGGGAEDYSSRGPSIDGRIKPDLAGFSGVSTFSAGVKTGTSIAAAHVAGAAAVYLGANPDLDPAELEALLLDSSSRPGRGNTLGFGVLNLGSPRTPQPPAGSLFTPQTRRVLNTNDGTGGKQGPFAANETFTLAIPNLPADTTAVVLDVTGSLASGSGGSLQVYADTPTEAGTLALQAERSNQTVAAITLDPVNKVVRIRNGGTSQSQVIVDLLGYFSTSSSTSAYFPLQQPYTMLDTRTWTTPSPKLGNGEVQTIRTRGVGGVPANATAAVVNLTASDASAASYVEAYAKDSTGKRALNVYPGDRLTKLAVVPIADDGSIRVKGGGGEAHVAVDLLGWFGPGNGAKYVPMRYTERVFDTTTGMTTPPSAFGSGQKRDFRVTLQRRIPRDITAAWFTMRATSRSTAPSPISIASRDFPWQGHTTMPVQWYSTETTHVSGSVQSGSTLTPLGATGIVSIRNEFGTAAIGPLRATPDLTVALQGYFVGGAPVAAPAAPATVGEWKLDEASGTTAADTSGRGQTITMQGGTSWIGGRFGRAAWLDGTSGFGKTAGPVVHTNQSFTVAAWVYQTQKSNYATVASQSGTNRSSFYLQYYPTQDRWRFVAPAADTAAEPAYASAMDSRPARVGEWTHLAGVYDAGAHQIKLYVNGALAGQDDATIWDAGGPLVLGGALSGTTASNFFPRGVDELRVFDKALTESEIRQVHKVTPSVQVGRWSFEEGTGTVAQDGTPQNGDLTLSGGATWTTAAALGQSALRLNGSTAYAAAPGRTVTTMDSFSVSAWANLSTKTGWQAVLSQDGGTMAPFFVQYNPDLDRWMIGGMVSNATDAAALPSGYSPKGVAVNQWTHLTGVYDSGARQFRLYVNGTLAGSADGVTLFDGTGAFNVGRVRYKGNFTNYFNGSIDEVHSYKGILTDAQITALATR